MTHSFTLSRKLKQTIQAHLRFLYGREIAAKTSPTLERKLIDFQQHHARLLNPAPSSRFTEADVVLLTYGDQIQAGDRPALPVLAGFLNRTLRGVVSAIHILPFFPYSSDDGFSIIDYEQVDPALGNWADFSSLRPNFGLMFDAVINHISAQSDWFNRFLQGDARYADYFIVQDPATDLSSVTRSRTHPLLTRFETAAGPKYVWTTFSADQVDLNYKNPQVLLDIIDVLLFYVAQGAEFIRLDAIGYLWKEIGASCIHLPQTHRVVQLFRTILDAVAPHVALITETNVPHAENISYFGDGRNEAQLVYNFSLPPLILHTLRTGNAEVLGRWTASLTTPGEQSEYTTYFNFIASHDGIGIVPAKNLLTEAEIRGLIDKTLAHGGLTNHKTNPDGSRSVYELNITLFDALSDPHSSEPRKLQIDRFMVSQAIMLALAGVPGIYIHSLFGSHNNLAGVKRTGHNRSINREKWQLKRLTDTLQNADSMPARVFSRYKRLLQVRTAHPAFHPQGGQRIIEGNAAVFALQRTAPDGRERILCLHNVTPTAQIFAPPPDCGPSLRDLFSGESFAGQAIPLAAYQVRWLQVLPPKS